MGINIVNIISVVVAIVVVVVQLKKGPGNDKGIIETNAVNNVGQHLIDRRVGNACEEHDATSREQTHGNGPNGRHAQETP